jgi:protein involved in polysaccharide export with SLBB domain
MKKIIKYISIMLIFNIIVPFFPSDAAVLDTLGLNIPNIQSINASEHSGPSASLGDSAMETPIDESSYKLGPGDVLGVHIIVGDADLTLDYNLNIGADGKMFFPNVGEVYLSDLSLKEAKAKLNSTIAKVYKEKYNLSMLLAQPKKVKIYLTGMVKNPGPLAVYDNSRVSEVIAQAGGVASGASNRYVYIKRGEKLLTADLFEAYRSRDLSKDIRVCSQDIIEVPDAQNIRISQNSPSDLNNKLLFEGHETYIYVYGEVARSGRFEYVPGKRLSDYLSYAGGPTSRALLSSVTLTRQVDGKAKKYGINASDVIYDGNSKNDIEIAGGDVINVPGNFFYFSDFSSFASMLFTGLALYNTFVK